MDVDLKQTRARLIKLALATLIGFAVTLGITLILPTRDHFPGTAGQCGCSHWSQGHVVTGGNPTLMLAGWVVVTLFAYGVLPTFARRISVPRARVVSSRW